MWKSRTTFSRYYETLCWHGSFKPGYPWHHTVSQVCIARRILRSSSEIALFARLAEYCRHAFSYFYCTVPLWPFSFRAFTLASHGRGIRSLGVCGRKLLFTRIWSRDVTRNAQRRRTLSFIPGRSDANNMHLAVQCKLLLFSIACFRHNYPRAESQ
jgi:hypothetical protein